MDLLSLIQLIPELYFRKTVLIQYIVWFHEVKLMKRQYSENNAYLNKSKIIYLYEVSYTSCTVLARTDIM